jgi:GTP-binding protein
MSLPIVTIVGRPNVGKSTLFNRMIKKKTAIVDDQPGVTRDRLYGEVEWQGIPFLLVDTGGYLPSVSSEMEIAVREQVEIAIEEADVILYLADRSTGITDWDLQISTKLKKSGKLVIPVINKVDNELMMADVYQFYGLGLGDPVGVSALHGRGTGDMLDSLTEKLQKLTPPQKEEGEIKLAVIGRENVGKSSFVNTLIGKKRLIVTTVPGTTRDPIDSPLAYKKRKYVLIDTAGLKRKARVKENILFYSHLRTLRSIQRADVVLYFLDAQQGPTRQDLRVVFDAVKYKKGVVLVINKWDLVPKDEKTMDVWTKALKERLGHLQFIPLVFTSVLEKKRLTKILDEATKVYDELQKKIKTSILNEKLLPLIQQTSPPASKGKEIKINYITQIKSNPPVIAFFCNFPKLIPESYRRFLERKIREAWGFEGVPLTLTFKAKRSTRRR